MPTILVFLLIFGSIVAFHEFGHFIIAKKTGVVVHEFAIGMGPKVIAWRDKSLTQYTIRLIPIGGYVRLAGPMDLTYELSKGQDIAIELNTDNQIVRINTSKKIENHSLPLYFTALDLNNQPSLTGIDPLTENTVTYKLADNAVLVNAKGEITQIAPIQKQMPSQPVWKQMLINIAGPINNFILAFVLFLALFFSQGGAPSDSNVIGSIIEDSIAETIGLQAGDVITAINGTEITSWDDIGFARDQAENNISLTYERNNKVYTKQATLDESGKLGIAPVVDKSLPIILSQTILTLTHTIESTFDSITAMFTRFNINDMGGPVAIYQLSDQAASQGSDSVLALAAILSVNLGLMNLIPIPALDGGKIALNLLQGFRKKPLKQETENIINALSALAVMVLLIAVTYNDLIDLFM